MRLLLRSLLPAVVLLAALPAWSHDNHSSAEEAVRAVVQQFEEGVEKRDLKKIEAVVADDMVALENGHRNDGWADFRDNHLVPEMQEPAPPSKTALIRLKVSGDMAWAYTRTDMKLTRRSGETVDAVLWSVYVVEKREGGWKIVLLDWSFYVPRAAAAK